MKLSCEIVQDLLPLYEDGVCSKESKAAVEAHLNECPSCREQFHNMQNFRETEIPVQTVSENRAIVKSFRKIRRRWAVSLAAMFLIIPVLLLTANQVRQRGVCYTNIDEIAIAGSYMRNLKNEEWKEAAMHIDYENQYNEIQALFGMTVEDTLSHFTSVIIGQDEWIVKDTDTFYQNYQQYIEDENLFWKYAVFTNAYPLVPIDNWEKMKAEMPELFKEDNEDAVVITEDLGEICYQRMETKWGTFMVLQSSELWEYTSADDFCAVLDFVPVEIYEEASAGIEKETQEQYDSLQGYYAAVENMSLEDFCNSMQNAYIQDLSECVRNGFMFEDSQYAGSEYVYVNSKGCWQITYSVDVVYKGKCYTIHLSPIISDGKIIYIEASWLAAFSDGNILYDALAVYYKGAS